jgi:hypothetical protein
VHANCWQERSKVRLQRKPKRLRVASSSQQSDRSPEDYITSVLCFLDVMSPLAALNLISAVIFICLAGPCLSLQSSHVEAKSLSAV